MMDLLSFFEDEKVTVTHRTFADGAYDAQGQWVQGTPTANPSFRIIAPQPLNSDDLQMVPQGEEAIDYLMSYSEALMKVRKNKEDSDEIDWKGYVYKITKVDSRDTLGGYYRFTMVRRREQV